MAVVEIGRETSPEGFVAGNGTVGASAAALAIGYPVLKHVVVRADSGNAGTITIGSTAGNASSGFILNAGDTSPNIYVDNTDKIFLIGSGADQDYSWLAS